MATEMSKESSIKSDRLKLSSETLASLRLTSSSLPLPASAAGASAVRTVTKKDLIDRISERTNIKRQDVKLAVQEFLEQVMTELQNGNRLEFRDFGVFEIKYRAPRVAQNPKTLQRVDVPAKRTVKFKVGRLMRESLEQSFQPAASHLNGSANGTAHGTANGTHASASVAQGLKSKTSH